MRAPIRSTPLAAVTVAAWLALAAAGCGGGAAPTSPSIRSKALAAAGRLEPPRAAQEIALRDWTGRLVRLSQFRGRAVLLTFIYDHCPDTCPLIVDKLRQALVELGRHARSTQLLAVSVDPRGDTPKTVRAFLAAHRMSGRMEYLIGSASQLAPVWKAYDIASEASPEQREVSHTALVYGITAKGVLLALYDQEFKPSDIAHDVPILASM